MIPETLSEGSGRSGQGGDRVELSAELRRDRNLDPSFAIELGCKQDVVVGVGDGNDVDVQLGEGGSRELGLRIAGQLPLYEGVGLVPVAVILVAAVELLDNSLNSPLYARPRSSRV
jgi:hypothetical protein